MLMLLAAVAALIILMPAKRWIGVALTVVISVFAIRGVTKVPWLAMAYGRRMLTVSGTGRPLYEGEGMNSSIVVSQLDGGQIYFHVSGKTEASTETYDMRLQRMLGHLSALATPKPKSVLIVGFGAGVTAGSFVTYPEIERIVRDSAPALRAQKKLEAEFAKRENELAKLSDQLKRLQDELEKDGVTMSETQRRNKERDFNDLNRDFQRKQREYREDVNQRRNEELSGVIDQANRIIRQIARRILEELRFGTDEAEDGAEALEICRRNMPDAILLDWNMPNMSGIEFLRALRREPSGGKPIVVFCTTEHDVAHITEAIGAGAN